MLDAYMKNLALKLLLDLLRAYSPTYEEEKAIKVLEEYSIKLGFDSVTVDSAGNLIAEAGSGDKTIALIGHVDTVTGQLPVTFDGGIVTGRGAVDAKGPLAAMFIASAKAASILGGDSFRVKAVAAVGEEGPSHGAWALVNGGFKADYIIVGEPTNVSNVAIGCRGSCRLIVECKSSGGHTANPELYESACVKLIEAWGLVSSRVNSLYTAAITRMACGEAMSNVVPRGGSMTVLIRIPVESSVSELMRVLEDILPASGCSWRIEGCIEPYKTSPSNPVARSLVRAIVVSGLKPRITVKMGTSDMNILSKITGNIAENGPGKPELSHTDHESINVNDYFKGIEVYVRSIMELSGKNMR
ncbi:MAG: M20/M25/M40 family metallo-hydrolase [Acidilobaceae archaeon]